MNLVKLKLIALMIAGPLALIYACYNAPVDTSIIIKRTPNNYALSAARQFVKESLESPSTAKFSPASRTTQVEVEKNVFEICGWVESENSSGVMDRSKFVCRVERTEDGKWRLLNLVMR